MKENKIILLTHKKLTGEITSEESQLLDSLNETSNEGVNIEKIWDASASYSPSVRFDSDSAFSAFQEKISNEPVVKPSFNKKWIWAAIAFIVFANISYGVYHYLTAPTIHYAETGVEKVDMPDGSLIYLAEGAKISYASNFGTAHRDVTLEGKAFFDVERNEQLQFNIEMDEHKVSVLGTEFNLDFDGKEVVLEVNEGKVRFESKEIEQVLVAAEAIAFDSKDRSVVKTSITDPTAFTWANNELSFNNMPLLKVFDTLGDYFNVDFKIDEEVALTADDCPFTSPNIKKPVLSEILEAMKFSHQVSYRFSEDSKTIDILYINCK